jgi:5'-phosphate synthase pdxT subunit
MPVFGTCAGMIACAARIVDGDPPILGIVDVEVRRNAYGRQVQSFEADLDVRGVGTVRGVFIRAPQVVSVGPGVEVLAEHDGKPVALRQGPVLLTSFHPELTGDERVHRAFVKSIE